MALVNIHFLNLQNNYLFADIAKKVNAFKVMHPGADVIWLLPRDSVATVLSRATTSCVRPS